jgi:hypothetical protein
MLLAKIRNIEFAADDYKQTVAFQKFGRELAKDRYPSIDAVMADNLEDAAKMLRKNLQDYIAKSQWLLYELGWFGFTISTTEVVNGRFGMKARTEHETIFPAVGDIL